MHVLPEEVLAAGREHVARPLPYAFTMLEQQVLEQFFTNATGRVFFIANMPENMVAVLMAMYSRMKNLRGIRGVFVEAFLPQVLGTLCPACEQEFDGNAAKFLKTHTITSLDQFAQDPLTADALAEFRSEIQINPRYIHKLVSSGRLSKFLGTWLDAYGHNSVARPAVFHLGFEGVTIIAAKSVEWCRPGFAAIELSTRYVEMSGAGLYPIADELSLYDVDRQSMYDAMETCFDTYRALDGDGHGPFPSFLRDRYRDHVSDADLKTGVFGETCDVLGNFLPAATLTSLGISISGEELPKLIEHLRLDNTPETCAIADAVVEQASLVGADQFLRHLDISNWTREGWRYLDTVPETYLPPNAQVESVLQNLLWRMCKRASVFQDLLQGKAVETDRTTWDKLPRAFEVINVSFGGCMSYRGWRDLQRMGLCSHKRSYMIPNHFYDYDKLAPEEWYTARKTIQSLYRELTLNRQRYSRVPECMQEYVLPLGFPVNYWIAGNLRQMEFVFWQRSKPDVNHEVRQEFLKMDAAMCREYPWWPNISRTNRESAYVFARGSQHVPL